MRMDLPHPKAGTVPSLANPIRFSETPAQYKRLPPHLGEHTVEVLRDVLALSNEDIDRLIDANVI